MNIEKKTAAFLALTLLALPTLEGCKKQESTGTAGAGSAVAATETVGEPVAAGNDSAQEADSKLGEKLSEYIDCFNGLSNSVRSSYDRYFDWVKDEKTGPTGKERNVYGLYKVDPESCLKSLDKAKSLQPSLPDVEAAAETYRTAANDLAPLVATAYKYYDQDDYKDDKFAKAKEMHGPLVEAFKKFEEADKALDGKVIALNDALGERRLKALEKDPNRKLQFLVEKSVADAKKLLAVSKVMKLENLDEAKMQEALTAYDTDVTNLETYSQANKAETDKVMMFSSVISNEQDLVKAAKALLRRKREKKDFNKEFFSNSNPSMVDGHPAQVVEKFNTLIRQVNGIRYDR